MNMPTPVLLHIDSGRRFRGGQNQVLLTARYLAQEGIKQIVAAPEYRDDGLNKSLLKRLDAIPSVPLSRYSLCRKLFLGRLAKVIREEGINVIHAHDSEAHTVGLRLKRKFPSLKLVVTRRVIFPPTGRVSVRHKYLGAVDHYIAISRAVAETLYKIGVDPGKVEVIPSAIDAAAIESTEPGNRIEAIQSQYDYLIASVGALTEEKDFKTAIAAFKKAALSRTALLIYGDGPLRGELENQIASGKIENVFLLGHRESLATDLKNCHIFFLTSRSEGLNSAAIEAAACGLPLVVSDVGGLPEIAEDNYNGLLCSAGDIDGFASALTKLLADDLLRMRMSENSKAKSGQFDMARSGKKILALYNRLLEGTQ